MNEEIKNELECIKEDVEALKTGNSRKDTDLDSITIGSGSKAQVKLYFNSRVDDWQDDLKLKQNDAMEIMLKSKAVYDSHVKG